MLVVPKQCLGLEGGRESDLLLVKGRATSREDREGAWGSLGAAGIPTGIPPGGSVEHRRGRGS